jgi:uncharacterized RDD family membrane protein YckC
MTTYTEKHKNDYASDMPLASIESRFAAIVIDSMILGAVAGAGWFELHETGAGLGLLIGLAYQWFFMTQNRGQTIGKMLMGIRVVRTDGEPLRASDAILRYLGYYLNSAVMMLGWLWAAWDEDRQGWHDKLARTVVVKAK